MESTSEGGDAKDKEMTEQRETDPPHADNKTPNTRGNNSGLVSRLTSSASALSASMLRAPPAVAELAVSTSSSGKEGGESSRQPATGVYELARRGNLQDPAGFTPSWQNQSGNSSFDSFLAGGPALDGPRGIQGGLSNRAAFDGLPIQEEARAGEPVAPSQGAAFSKQASRDGLEVAELLSRADFDAQWQEVAGNRGHDEPIPLGSHEAARLGAALFGNGAGSGGQDDWDLLLNFVPPQLREAGDRSLEDDIVALIGVTDVAEARRIWLTQWDRVLNRYTDEVWGDLSPLVSQARQDVKMSTPADDAADPKSASAVKRLRMVLAHVRARL